jgi:hypothetical protein
MAAPEYVPIEPTPKVRTYRSPDHVPPRWTTDRPAEIGARQPAGGLFGYQGPDQGYALKLARDVFAERINLHDGEHRDDAVMGSIAIALRRASLFGRAPTVHDLTVAFTIWGWLDPSPPAELVEHRRRAFAGVGHTGMHYQQWRLLADGVPEATLRLPHATVQSSHPNAWKELLGL